MGSNGLIFSSSSTGSEPNICGWIKVSKSKVQRGGGIAKAKNLIRLKNSENLEADVGKCVNTGAADDYYFNWWMIII